MLYANYIFHLSSDLCHLKGYQTKLTILFAGGKNIFIYFKIIYVYIYIYIYRERERERVKHELRGIDLVTTIISQLVSVVAFFKGTF